MKAIAKYSLLFLALALSLCGQAPCGDLLAGQQAKPEHLEFQECKQQVDLQGKPLQAKYRVEGKYAADVEKFLTKHLKIAKLKRNCCLWESTNNSSRDKQGRLFTITVGTLETSVRKRGQWSQIPYFYIEVNQYAEAP